MNLASVVHSIGTLVLCVGELGTWRNQNGDEATTDKDSACQNIQFDYRKTHWETKDGTGS